MREFAAAPVPVRAWVSVAVPLAVILSLLLSSSPSPVIRSADVITALALIAGSVVNVELGRLLEGGRVAQQRPHKALSAWPMAAIILLPSFYLAPIVALVYLHARWRGVRVTLWKWIASASFLIWAGAIAGLVVRSDGGIDGGQPPTLTSGLAGLLIVLAAAATFLAVETGMLGVTALLNTPEDEVWLRRTLADPAFYLMEAGVITLGAITGVLGASAPWFVLLLVPAYGFLQQSVLHRPLQEQATHDPKTGLLHFNAWQRLAAEEIGRLNAVGRPWAVLFTDIDDFRTYNQRHGHLGGDRALELVARIITAQMRRQDLIARFGGEEFCVLLPNTAAELAELMAERLRAAVRAESSVLPERITVSVGVATVESGNTPIELAVVLALADQALYQAKLDGRDRVRLRQQSIVLRLPTEPENEGRSDRHPA